MRIFKAFISLALIVALIGNLCLFNTVFAEESATRYFVYADFEGEELPSDLVYNSGSGNITIEDVGGKRAMYMNNGVDGSYTLVTSSFGAVTAGDLIVEASFMQPYAKSNGNIIFELLYLNNKVFSVLTAEGNICAVKADGTYEVLVENYAADTWYDLKVQVRILNGTCNYFVNETPVLSNQPFAGAGNGADTISSYARYSPGFYLDDFKVSQKADYERLEVVGATPIESPSMGEPEYTFTAVVPNEEYNEYILSANIYSSDGAILEGERLVWSIEGDASSAVSIESTDNPSKAILNVKPEAVAGSEVIVKVSTPGGFLSKKIKVVLEPCASDNIKIIGEPRVSSYKGEIATFNYEAKLYDQLGGEIPNQNFVWSVENLSVADVSISQTGVLSVQGSMPQNDEKIIVKAALAGDENVYGQKSILVQSYDTYHNDKQRLSAAIQGVDSILKAGSNPDGRNPLIASFVNPYKNTYAYWNLHGPEKPTANSNLTEQFLLMRSMDGITNLTGDESYAQRVDEIYQWYLDHAIARDGLLYWGNHQSLDLETGERALYYEKFATSENYVEVKGRSLYFEPFFELDEDAALKIIKDHWTGIINNWGTMSFNRHALVDNNADPNYSGWENLDNYLEKPNADDPLYPDDPFVRSYDLCFSSSACDLLDMATEYYLNSSNPEDGKKMILWGYNLMKRYMSTADPDTGIFAAMFNSMHRAPGKLSLEDTYGEYWWTIQGMRETFASQSYGDRAYNQFAHMLVSGGYLTEEEADNEVREGHMHTYGGTTTCFDYMMTSAIEMAKVMINSGDPELQAKGNEILEAYLIAAKSYIEIAYDFEQNKVHNILSNGIVLDGIRWTRPGYWGSVGKTWEPYSPYVALTIGFLNLYLNTGHMPEYNEHRQVIWSAVKNILDKSYNMGDIGDPILNEKPNLNLATNSTDSQILRFLFDLYEASGSEWEEYLTMARVVGNNIISDVFKEGYFIPDSSLVYLCTEGEYPYVLLKLESYLRGEPELVDKSEHKSISELVANWYDERGKYRKWDSNPLESDTFPSVKATDVIIDEYNIQLTVGDKHPLNVTVLPDDASSKALTWDVRDKDIVSIDGNNVISALKEGETVVYAFSKSTANVFSKPIHIIVSREEIK